MKYDRITKKSEAWRNSTVLGEAEMYAWRHVISDCCGRANKW